MIDGMASRQRKIVAWFDATYRRKGRRYLRPKRAYLVFLELLEARDDDMLLDVACGPGVLLEAASGYTQHLHGIDISEVAIAQAREGVPGSHVVVGNAQELPYVDATFDMITCLGSLERMLDAPRALREMLRVGTRDARYCFLVRNSATVRWRSLAPLSLRHRTDSHAGADSLRNWTALFESQGFRIIRTLPDQYPLQRRLQWFSLFLECVDFRRVVTTKTPLEAANEFLFLLEKAQ